MTAYHRWTRTFVSRPDAGLRLVCFPYAGGSATAFREWPQLLPSTVEIVAIQYPGRNDRFAEALVPDLTTLADEITEAIAPELGRNTIFFGHSLGATLAFEVARRLRPKFPAPLARLIVSARRAPSVPQLRHEVLGDQDLRARVHELGGRGSAVLDDAESLALMLPMLRNDFAMANNYRYRPGPPLACPITAITASEDQAVDPSEVQRWRDHTIGGFELLTVEGGHFYLEERLSGLLDQLRIAETVPQGVRE